MYMVKRHSWPVDRFRDLIDHILRETGLPQVQLAALVPMDQSQLSRWKSGSSKPKFESLESLGAALVERYPTLGIGPEELTSTVYPREAVVDISLPSLGAEVRAVAEPSEPAHDLMPLPPELADIQDPTPYEAAVFQILSAMRQEMADERQEMADEIKLLRDEVRGLRIVREQDNRDQKGA